MKIIKEGVKKPLYDPTDYYGVWTCLRCDTIVEIGPGDKIERGWTSNSLEVFCPVCKETEDYHRLRKTATGAAADVVLWFLVAAAATVIIWLIVWSVMEAMR